MGDSYFLDRWCFNKKNICSLTVYKDWQFLMLSGALFQHLIPSFLSVALVVFEKPNSIGTLVDIVVLLSSISSLYCGLKG